MKNTFKVGTNFDLTLLDKIVELNKKYPNSIINEVYGSTRDMAFAAARPDFRLPDVKNEQLETYVQRCNDLGICFNYTLNTINPGSKRELQEWKKKAIQDYVQYLWSIGVYRVTVANPIIMEIIREVNKEIQFEVSTILHVDAVTQIKYLHDQYNIKKVCCGIHKNRSVSFLKRAAEFCNKNGIIFELLVNEFCSNAGKGYTTHCSYRDSCYIFHSTDITAEDAQSLGGYPMQHCIKARDTDPFNWLRTRFIRPQDLELYRSIGISQFKVSGRTGTTEYIVKVLEAYASEKFEGNLLELWKPLETIYNGQSELDHQHQVYLETSLLDGFLNKRWFKHPDFDCANEICGTTCKYCERYYKRQLSKNDRKPDEIEIKVLDGADDEERYPEN
ncbi:peptidase [Proteus phage vB_PmiM_Pm5461]|uniref:Peptidase n=1 Tax=Proteus phage vB_PmiM_Pm5461 TaxID=1636250 RepID=A0A0G2SSU7_9CAUD|nr:peptidase [Proteus phage vB_PmiM_Pm5461]AKA61900.1 peptidase [Proteus phage vB_PmiM_Pm5461]